MLTRNDLTGGNPVKRVSTLGAHMKNVIYILLTLFFTQCSVQKTPTSPLAVDPKDVGTIVLTDDKNRQSCLSSIRQAGARILYQNDLGLLFLDKSDQKLVGCSATTVSNTPIRLAPPSSVAPPVDLPTLLKLIPAEEIGARSFVQDNPSFDGRNITVAILDTGLELDHPLLKKTTTGEDKIVDLQDFSGEGRVELTPVVVADGVLVSPNGVAYSVKSFSGSDFHFGVFLGSTLAYSEDVAAKDVFKDVGVISYRRPEGKWVGRIDTDDDKSFENEAELFNYAQSRIFTKLGEKKILTTALNLSEDGKVASLAFDDGAHGTHVAGIAAGFDPNGLSGVAPGAKVIGAKIGDNRLSGGSTTTASMLLAIDFAVQAKVHVINLSYGIRAGSNIGKSTIDQYVDKVAREKGMLFSISAGNEGPGLLTIGTPAGASLAITNGAYVSSQTAKLNYGFVGMELDTIWFFSSVGPRLDGGLKPTLLAPGSALSSVPMWDKGYENYRGTSMASPQTTGGLALILSGAVQSNLPMDRVSVTQAVYQSAKKIEGLKLVEQGHGLMDVPRAFSLLKNSTDGAVEYDLSVSSPTSPDSKGKGIYTRSRVLPSNPFTVTVTPVLSSVPAGIFLKTFRLQASAPWIRTVPNFWIHSGPRAFQVELDPAVLSTPGVHSEQIEAIDEATGKLAFLIPVTVVSATSFNDGNHYSVQYSEKIRVGQTLRFFLDIPAGSTAVQVDLVSDGPIVWGQLLDPEGRQILQLMDSERTFPQPPLYGAVNLGRAGIYELDLISPAYNLKTSAVGVKVQIFSLKATLGAMKSPGQTELLVENNYSALKVIPKFELTSVKRKTTVNVSGNGVLLPIVWGGADSARFSMLQFQIATSKAIYDLMTDYPYRIFCADKSLHASGGLELLSEITLDQLCLGTSTLEVSGAFTDSAPEQWSFDLKETRLLKSPIGIFSGKRLLIETGQTVLIPIDLTKFGEPLVQGMQNCGEVRLETPTGRTVQTVPICSGT